MTTGPADSLNLVPRMILYSSHYTVCTYDFTVGTYRSLLLRQGFGVYHMNAYFIWLSCRTVSL